jgi:y4mF family transcriptional regulator
MPRIKTPIRPSPIGQFVRERRRANRLTQVQLGDLAGVTPRIICELERGKPTMQMDLVNRVLAVFGKTLGVADQPREVPEHES